MRPKIPRSYLRPARRCWKILPPEYSHKNITTISRNRTTKFCNSTLPPSSKVITEYDFFGPISKLTPSDAIKRGLGDGSLLVGFVSIFSPLLIRFFLKV